MSTPTGATLPTEANLGASLEAFQKMARRRFQAPTPQRRGMWWTLRFWQDEFVGGKHIRRFKRIRLAPATMSEREARRIAAEHLRPMNQGLQSVGSATNFRSYCEKTYTPLIMPLLAKTTVDRYQGVLDNYLLPSFGDLCLRDLDAMHVQRYFSNLAKSSLQRESIDKIRDVLSAVLGSAKQYGLLVINPCESIRLPRDRRGRKQKRPFITPEQFDLLIEVIPEPYASMVYVAIYTGLRVSELIGLRWSDIGEDKLTVDERYCRGDWSEPKSFASNATIGVDHCVVERIMRMKTLTVEVKAGRATRRYKVVKRDGPEDLVFQSVKDGKPMRDNNILTRFIKPAGRKLGFGFVNWLCLRTSRATWMIEAGSSVKDVQGQMRHSRASTTMDLYAQCVPESQQRAIEKTAAMIDARIGAARAQRSANRLLN